MKIIIEEPSFEGDTVGIYITEEINGEERIVEGGEFNADLFYDHIKEFYEKHF